MHRLEAATTVDTYRASLVGCAGKWGNSGSYSRELWSAKLIAKLSFHCPLL